MERSYGRGADALRPTEFELGIQRQAAGSVLISTGATRVICAASVESSVPPWMRNRAEEQGWVTAEYGMLPGSGDSRIRRKQSARSTEIQRLIGRSLRAVVDLGKLPGHTIHLDCDVLDADGGTRTASITGAWVALHLACQKLVASGAISEMPISGQLAAVSVGVVGATPLLDLDYSEASPAEVDMNVVGDAKSRIIEVQGTAEGEPFSRAQLDRLLDLAQKGINELQASQRAILGLE